MVARVDVSEHAFRTQLDRLAIVGLIGGMGWESSALYYQVLNTEVRRRFGGTRSARCILWSCDLGELEPLVERADWAALTVPIVDAAVRLERAGAELLGICSNLSHVAADAVAAAVSVPLVHIADPVARQVKAAGAVRIGVLGARPTLELGCLTRRWSELHNLKVLVPCEGDLDCLQRIVYGELLTGQIGTGSRLELIGVMRRLIGRGAQVIVLACTELSLIVSETDVLVPVLDSALLHARDLAELSIANPSVPRSRLTVPTRV